MSKRYPKCRSLSKCCFIVWESLDHESGSIGSCRLMDWFVWPVCNSGPPLNRAQNSCSRRERVVQIIPTLGPSGIYRMGTRAQRRSDRLPVGRWQFVSALFKARRRRSRQTGSPFDGNTTTSRRGQHLRERTSRERIQNLAEVEQALPQEVEAAHPGLPRASGGCSASKKKYKTTSPGAR